MIDIENVLYTEVRNAAMTAFPKLTMSGIEERFPSSFPFASVVQADSTTRTDTIDSGNYENHVNVMYEVNVYSNSTKDRKGEAKAILAVIDKYMITHGFSRTSQSPATMDNATIYRLIARYTGCADKNYTIYRR